MMKKALKEYAPEIKCLLEDYDKQQIVLTESEISYFTVAYIAGRLKGKSENVELVKETTFEKVRFPLLKR
jgi:hypothetical protein